MCAKNLKIAFGLFILCVFVFLSTDAYFLPISHISQQQPQQEQERELPVINEREKRSARIVYNVFNRGSISELATASASVAMSKIKGIYNSLKNIITEKKQQNSTENLKLKNIKLNHDKILSQRMIPSMSNMNAQQISRKTRSIPAFLPVIGKLVAWTGTMTAAGVATSYIDTAIKEKAAREQEERLARKSIDCELNNFGCIQNICWSNCGPRLYSADWCFVTKNLTVSTEGNVELAHCEKDSDCQACWRCASSCIMEGTGSDEAYIKLTSSN